MNNKDNKDEKEDSFVNLFAFSPKANKSNDSDNILIDENEKGNLKKDDNIF